MEFSGEIKKQLKINAIIDLPKNTSNMPVFIFAHSAGFYHEDNLPKKLMPKYQVNAICDTGFLLVQPINTRNDIWHPDEIFILVKELSKHYDIDTNKITISGYSMGARLCLDALCSYPELFSCGMAISGFACYLRAARIAEYSIPVIAAHGLDDEVVPIDEMCKMVDALKSKRNPVHFFKSKGGHGAWCHLLHDKGILEWMKAQSKVMNASRLEEYLTK